MTYKKSLASALAIVTLFCMSAASQASFVVYTNEASFLAAVSSPGTDTFNDLTITGTIASPITRSAGVYGYTASVSTTSFFNAGTVADVWLSTNTATDTITINGFSAGVTAIGGFFFGSDISGSFTAGSITTAATDGSGTVVQTVSGGPTTSFVGFISDGPLTSLTVTSVQPTSTFLWPAVNNLTLATTAPVPEPETYAMLLAGLGLLGWVGRRRKQQTS